METLISRKLKSLGKTQNEIASEVGVSQTYIANVINGKVLKTNAIKRFTDIYKWDLYEIIKDFESSGSEVTLPADSDIETLEEIEDNLNVSGWFESLKIEDKLDEIYKLSLGKLSTQDNEIKFLSKKVDKMREIITSLNSKVDQLTDTLIK